MSAARLASHASWYVAVTALAAVFLGPFIWAVGSSLKTPSELFVYPPTVLPAIPRWDNYERIWRIVPLFLFTTNSFFVGILATVGQVLSASAVAYGFARFNFPFRNALFMCLLSTLILPEQVTMVPRFLLFKQIGWLDTLLPLWVPAWLGGSAFFVFLMRQFFLTIPRELDDAAEIDGASTARVFVNILLPLSLPALATVAIFAFLWNWNEFLQPLIYLNSVANFTLPLGLRFLVNEAGMGGEPKEHLLMAASLLDTVPPVVLFFALQRYFVRGIVTTGLKF